MIQTKEQREQLKNESVILREKRDFKGAIAGFSEVLAWDRANNNTSGLVDILGHLKIAYTNMADSIEDKDQRVIARKNAYESASEALEVSITTEGMKPGTLANAKMHKISAGFDWLTRENDVFTKDQKQMLQKFLEEITEVIKDFPGSLASRAWPANLKAQIEICLEKYEQALDTILTAHKWIYDGYAVEAQKDDQMDLKISVWVSGLYLTSGLLFARTGKPVVARFYITSVLNMGDPNGYLKTRKVQAQILMEKLGL